MKVYVVVIEDRHTDVDVEVFRTYRMAERIARDTAIVQSRDGEPQERDYGKDASWRLYLETSVEGDNVRIVECELNG